MDQIPREVAEAVRAAASERTAYQGDLTGVRRRVRRRRRRALAAAAAGVLVITAGAGAAAVLRGPQPAPTPMIAPSPPPSAVVSASPPVSPPAQRILLQGAYGAYRTGVREPSFRLASDDHVGEVLPGMVVKRHRVQGADSWDASIGLPDGRIVALGPRDLQPGVRRADGPDVSGLEFNLVVVGADGKVGLRRDVRRKGEALALAGATATTAYLLRPGGLVAHTLASGKERVVVPRAKLGVAEMPGPDVEAYTVEGNRLVMTRSGASCAPVIVDLATGGLVTNDVLLDSGCKWVTGLRVSPGADRVAVVYQTGAGDGYRLAVVRTADGGVLKDDELRVPSVDGKQDGMLVDLGWLDDRTVRAIAVPVGPGTHTLIEATAGPG